MNEACRAADIDAYVTGALDLRSLEAFEAHTASCDACAEALADAARLEMAFERVVRREARARAARPLRTMAYGAAGVLAMAAAALLWIGRSAAPMPPDVATAASHAPLDDGAILDARNDALDGG